MCKQVLVVERIGESVSGQAGLAGAECVAAAAQAKILVGNDEAVFGIAQQGQPPAGGLVHPVLVQQQAKAGVGATAYPAAELMQLRQAEAFGVLDHHHRGFGDVDADLDHRGGDQQADGAGREGGQRGVADFGRLLAVGEADRVAEELLQMDIAIRGGRDVQRLAFGDERADPVDLGAFAPACGRRPPAPSASCPASAAWCESAAGRPAFRSGG